MSKDKTWREFINNNEIGKKFHEVEIENVYKLRPTFKRTIQQFLQKPFSLILSGSAGLGKTYASLALIRELLGKYQLYSIRYMKAKSIDDIALQLFRENKQPTEFIRVIKQAPLLFIDDFGIDKTTDRVIRDLFEIIDYRWENSLPLILSTNLADDQIKEIYGERIYSRLKEAKRLIFGGEDLRGEK